MAERFPIYIRTYGEAENIVRGFSTQEAYLRDLAWNRIWSRLSEEEKRRWPVKYRDLVYHGRRILGIAKKMRRTRTTNKLGIKSRLKSKNQDSKEQVQMEDKKQKKWIQITLWIFLLLMFTN